jgi:hypothetical protein
MTDHFIRLIQSPNEDPWIGKSSSDSLTLKEVLAPADFRHIYAGTLGRTNTFIRVEKALVLLAKFVSSTFMEFNIPCISYAMEGACRLRGRIFDRE